MRKLAVWLLALVIMPAGLAADGDHDTRPLRPAEEHAFRLLVCGKPVLSAVEKNCSRIASYPHGGVDGPTRIDLAAISYGAFTAAGVDQALVSYTADFEPHVNNWGGSILFERRDGRWRLLRWFPGTLTDECVALPGPQQAMLCLAGWSGQGEDDSSLWLIRMTANGQLRQTAVLKAQDDISAGPEDGHVDYQCGLPRRKDEGILFSIEGLKRSRQSGVLAEAKIRYAAPDAVAQACRKHRLDTVRTRKAVITFRVEAASVVAETPVKFAKTDY